MADDDPQDPTPPPLDRARIVDAALALARTPDRNAVSFRRLGPHLGVDPTAVYRHFRSKAELVDAALDRLYGEAVAAVPRHLPWRARFEALGTQLITTLLAHPAIAVDAGARSTGGPGEAAGVDAVLACLGEAGLGEADAATYWGISTMLTLNFASAQAEVLLWRTDVGADHPPPALSPPGDLARFPALQQHLGAIVHLDWGQVLTEASRLVADAVEARGGGRR